MDIVRGFVLWCSLANCPSGMIKWELLRHIDPTIECHSTKCPQTISSILTLSLSLSLSRSMGNWLSQLVTNWVMTYVITRLTSFNWLYVRYFNLYSMDSNPLHITTLVAPMAHLRMIGTSSSRSHSACDKACTASLRPNTASASPCSRCGVTGIVALMLWMGLWGVMYLIHRVGYIHRMGAPRYVCWFINHEISLINYSCIYHKVTYWAT